MYLSSSSVTPLLSALDAGRRDMSISASGCYQVLDIFLQEFNLALGAMPQLLYECTYSTLSQLLWAYAKVNWPLESCRSLFDFTKDALLHRLPMETERSATTTTTTVAPAVRRRSQARGSSSSIAALDLLDTFVPEKELFGGPDTTKPLVGGEKGENKETPDRDMREISLKEKKERQN